MPEPMNIDLNWTWVWSQNGPRHETTQQQYEDGWGYIGASPPTVEQFNAVMNLQDVRSMWLYSNLTPVQSTEINKKANLTGGNAITGDQDIAGSVYITGIMSSDIVVSDPALLLDWVCPRRDSYATAEFGGTIKARVSGSDLYLSINSQPA